MSTQGMVRQEFYDKPGTFQTILSNSQFADMMAATSGVMHANECLWQVMSRRVGEEFWRVWLIPFHSPDAKQHRREMRRAKL